MTWQLPALFVLTFVLGMGAGMWLAMWALWGAGPHF